MKVELQSRASRTVSKEDFWKYGLLQVAALRNINVVRDLFTDHGERFMW